MFSSSAHHEQSGKKVATASTIILPIENIIDRGMTKWSAGLRLIMMDKIPSSFFLIGN